MKKIISLLIFCLFSISAYSKTVDVTAVNQYANKLVQDGLDILRNNALSQDQKVQQTKDMIVTNLDINWMSKYTLGNYRRTITPEQITQFTKIYREYVSKAYADLVKSYTGQKAKIIQVTNRSDSEFMVDLSIINNGGQGNTKVSYLIRLTKDGNNEVLKVSDVITEGVSLIRSQQSEFTNIISSRGFDALLAELRSKL